MVILFSGGGCWSIRQPESYGKSLKEKLYFLRFWDNFLVGDRISNILYSRLHHNCSSLKYDLFQCNFIKDCVCGFIREDTSHFLLTAAYILSRGQFSNFSHYHNFRRDIRTLLFGDSQKDLAQNILLSKAVGNSLKEHTPLPHFTYMLSFFSTS